jgi:hypothetical protein
VSPGQPSLISDDADVVALIGTSKDLAKQINQKELHWGVCMFSIKLAVSFFFLRANLLFPTLSFMKFLFCIFNVLCLMGFQQCNIHILFSLTRHFIN